MWSERTPGGHSVHVLLRAKKDRTETQLPFEQGGCEDHNKIDNGAVSRSPQPGPITDPGVQHLFPQLHSLPLPSGWSLCFLLL